MTDLRQHISPGRMESMSFASDSHWSRNFLSNKPWQSRLRNWPTEMLAPVAVTVWQDRYLNLGYFVRTAW